LSFLALPLPLGTTTQQILINEQKEALRFQNCLKIKLPGKSNKALGTELLQGFARSRARGAVQGSGF